MAESIAIPQATRFIGVVRDSLAQHGRRHDVGLGHDLLPSKKIGHHHTDISLTGHYRNVLNCEWTRIDLLLRNLRSVHIEIHC